MPSQADSIAGEVNEKATDSKEGGHSANAPSVVEGFKKLDRTLAARNLFSELPNPHKLSIMPHC